MITLSLALHNLHTFYKQNRLNPDAMINSNSQLQPPTTYLNLQQLLFQGIQLEIGKFYFGHYQGYLHSHGPTSFPSHENETL